MKKLRSDSRFPEREPFVRVLFGECGLSYKHTGKLLSVTDTTIRKDVRRMGGKEVFGRRPGNIPRRYQACFAKCAKLSAKRDLDPFTAKLLGMLGEYLNIRRLSVLVRERKVEMEIINRAWTGYFNDVGSGKIIAPRNVEQASEAILARITRY
ncbi:MAG: hypothetical protein ABIA47_03830 [bacterium]